MKNTQTFLEFTNDLRGYKVFREYYYNGYRRRDEMPKYRLYWGGITIKEIHTNPNYKIERR